MKFAFAIVLAILPVPGAWCLGAFVAWDWNPGHWDAPGRFIIAMLGILTPFPLAMMGWLLGAEMRRR